MLATRFSDRDRTAFTMKNPYFCADRESEYAMQPVRCVTGDAPTLAEVDDYFGKQAASEWLVPLLADLSIYTSAKNLGQRQQKQLAKTIAVEYRSLKVTEMMLFFHRFKAGHYGRFYGAVDPMVVMCALQDFIKERDELRNKIKEQEADLVRKQYEDAWPKCAEELKAHIGLTSSDVWLNVIDPYNHAIRICIGSQEALNRIESDDVIDKFMDIIQSNYGKDIDLTYRKTWID